MILRTASLVLLLTLAVSPTMRAAESITLQIAYDVALRSYETVKMSEENVFQGESRVDPQHCSPW
jgi:hypothetical protein